MATRIGGRRPEGQLHKTSARFGRPAPQEGAGRAERSPLRRRRRRRIVLSLFASVASVLSGLSHTGPLTTSAGLSGAGLAAAGSGFSARAYPLPEARL